MNDINANTQLASLQNENKKLRIAVEELSVLNDIATAITTTQPVETIVDLIVQKCVKHLHVEQGAVMLFDETDESNVLRTLVRKQDTVANHLPYRLDTQLTGWMQKNKAPLLINEFKQDERFSWLAEESLPINSLLSVPLMIKGKMIGILSVFNKHGNASFSGNDQRLLSIIAAQSAQVIENARLYQEEQSYLRMQEEIRLAGEIQETLLPTKLPQIPGYQIAGRSIAAKEVGGDYFDFVSINDNELIFCLGDISGKGMPAALLMANLQATLRGQIHSSKCCSACIKVTNTLLHQSTDSKKFATLFLGKLNVTEGTLTYCNAGHDNPMFIQPSGEIQRLQNGGIVLGFVPEFDFIEETVSFKPGSILVIYSDGITEAMNSSEEEFGEERLQNLVLQNRALHAVEIIEIIISEINKHTGSEPQMDDETLVIIKRDTENC